MCIIILRVVDAVPEQNLVYAIYVKLFARLRHEYVIRDTPYKTRLVQCKASFSFSGNVSKL